MIQACLQRLYEVYSENPDLKLIERCRHEDYLEPILEKLGMETVYSLKVTQ